MAKLDEVWQEGPRELNRWDVALEIFTLEEAYRLRRFVDKVSQPVNERRGTLGLPVHDDNGGDDVVDGTALPAGSSAVTPLGHDDGGAPCVGNNFVMGVNSNVRVPANSRDRVLQDDGFVQPCNTISMHPDASGMDGCQQHTEAMDNWTCTATTTTESTLSTSNSRVTSVSKARRSMSMVSNACATVESSLPTATSLVHH